MPSTEQHIASLIVKVEMLTNSVKANTEAQVVVQKDIYNLLHKTREELVANTSLVANHEANKTIHHVPPCEIQKSLSDKLWGLLVLSVGGIITGLIAIFEKR
jgi:hypothetical protein